MAEIYDNWERLVKAVLLKEHLKEIALISSSSSGSSSFSSTSEGQSSDLPSDNSDLTVDHSDWKALLPPDKQEVVWKSIGVAFSLDESSGKNIFMLGPQHTQGRFISEFRLLGQQQILEQFRSKLKYYSKSRFGEVVMLESGAYGYIGGIMKKQMLAPNTYYGTYLVFGLLCLMHDDILSTRAAGIVVGDLERPKYLGLPIATFGSFKYLTKYPMLKYLGRTVYLQGPINKKNGHVAARRSDGWMEVELGEFFVREGDNMSMKLALALRPWTNDFVVEGIEFRPKRERRTLRSLFQLSD